MIISYSGLKADFEHTALKDCYLHSEKWKQWLVLDSQPTSITACKGGTVRARKSILPEKKRVKPTSKLP